MKAPINLSLSCPRGPLRKVPQFQLCSRDLRSTLLWQKVSPFAKLHGGVPNHHALLPSQSSHRGALGSRHRSPPLHQNCSCQVLPCLSYCKITWPVCALPDHQHHWAPQSLLDSCLHLTSKTQPSLAFLLLHGPSFSVPVLLTTFFFSECPSFQNITSLFAFTYSLGDID